MNVKELKKSYSAYTQEEAEKHIGLSFGDIFNNQKRVEDIIDIKATNIELKEKVYNNLVDYITVEDFPIGSLRYIKGANITDMVAFIIVPIIADYKNKQNKEKMKLRREKEIIGPDNTSDIEEFVVIDMVETNTEIIVVIVEAKRADIDKAITQCILALHDAYSLNKNNKPVYGFMTTGIHWKLIKYDGKLYQMSEEFTSAFALMKDDKQRWFNECSKIVDIFYHTLSH